MTKNINSHRFSATTQLKLEIFRECFREWLPVFLHNQFISKIFIYDLFAGSGKDICGNHGSPLLLLEEFVGYDHKNCELINKNTSKEIKFIFNDKQRSKTKTLKQNIIEFLDSCKENCNYDSCLLKSRHSIENLEFHKLFNNPTFTSILKNPDYGKFIILDQYGFKQIDNDIFNSLVVSPKTDFIFFISSSTIRRFHNSTIVKEFLADKDINFNPDKHDECHREIANYFRSLIPSNKEYYLHHFTISKPPNYYGLIFGTNHPFGMEKFLKVCWRTDIYSGESNCNIDNDYVVGTLFHNPSNTNKVTTVKQDLERLILTSIIKNNISGMKYALSKGCLPSIYVDIITNLVEQKRVSIIGNFNKKSSGIHRINPYQIKVL
jgi:three-Cys-motif partner protein